MDGYQKPWETPKIQMILSIFDGILVSVTPVSAIAKIEYEEVER